MDSLTDRKAVQLAELIVLYFADCRAEDPGCTPASELTVLELLEDLAMSTYQEDGRKIEDLIDQVNAKPSTGWEKLDSIEPLPND